MSKRNNKTSVALDDESLAILNLLARANGISRSELMLRIIQSAALRTARPGVDLTITDHYQDLSHTAKARVLGELHATLEAKAAEPAPAPARPPVTTTSSAWMLRIEKAGKWECDLGEYFDCEDVLAAIARKVPRTGEAFIPVKITTVKTIEFHPQS